MDNNNHHPDIVVHLRFLLNGEAVCVERFAYPDNYASFLLRASNAARDAADYIMLHAREKGATAGCTAAQLTANERFVRDVNHVLAIDVVSLLRQSANERAEGQMLSSTPFKRRAHVNLVDGLVSYGKTTANPNLYQIVQVTGRLEQRQ